MRRAQIALLLLIAGCGGPSLVEYTPRVHVVQPGETLFGIAWRYGVDYRDLARWNGLANPDFIRAGQRLVLAPATQAQAGASRSASSAGAASAPRGQTPPAASSASRGPTVGSSASRGPTVGSSASRGPTASSSTSRAPASPTAAREPAASSPSPEWRWPTSGPIVSRFAAGEGVTTGIGIGGREGQDVQAAASGRVVYAGGGLVGYGQAVIIRHNDTYLSAYGYSSRLLVEQGQVVERGQKIAEMGLGPGRRPQLHFEIRRNGVPVDPLQFLQPR